MNKKTIILMVIISSVVLSAIISAIAIFQSQSFSLLTDNVEVLANENDPEELNPAIITCDSGNSGYCHTFHMEIVDPWGLIVVYSCQFTGCQQDYCSALTYLLNV